MVMTSKADGDLEAALSALARELGPAEPRPGPELTSGVLADAALILLAREVDAVSPRPSPELVARVLADAAEVAAAGAARHPALPSGQRRRAPARAGVAEWLFGWRGGAVAVMTLGLVAGLGLGLEAGPGTLPLLDEVDAGPLALAEAEPILFVEGL
jgi:hypothetical protein